MLLFSGVPPDTDVEHETEDDDTDAISVIEPEDINVVDGFEPEDDGDFPLDAAWHRTTRWCYSRCSALWATSVAGTCCRSRRSVDPSLTEFICCHRRIF